MTWRETECPHFEQCGGEIQFEEETTEAYIGLDCYAVMVGQTCTCALAQAQVDALETEATEALQEPPEPYVGED